MKSTHLQTELNVSLGGCVLCSLSHKSWWISVTESLPSVKGHRGLRLLRKGIVTSSCLSLSTCKQCITINWRALRHWATALLVLRAAATAAWSKWEEFLTLRNQTKIKIKQRLKRRQLFPQEMFKKRNTMWKFRWVKIVVLMIQPCCSLTSAISLILQIHSSECSEPIHSKSVLAIKRQASASSDISGPV